MTNKGFIDVTATITTVQGESYSGAGLGVIVVSQSQDEYIVDTCTFTDCVNTGNGGAIDIRLTNGGKASVINSQFTGCQANAYGGAIYADIQSGGILTINGQCKFTQCTAQNNGGGIYIQINGAGSKLIIGDGAIFDTCSSQSSGGGLEAQVQTGAQLVFEGDCKFINCSVNSGSGGGISAYCNNEGSSIRFLGELKFDNCSSTQSGGGASIGSDDKASIELNKVTCVDCKGRQGAGLNVLANAYFSMSGKASFTRCECTGYGGGIYFSIQGNAEIQLTGEMEFIDCIGNYGGGLSIYSSQIISVISSSIIFQNCTGTSGGGMYMFLSNIETEIQINGELSFDNCSGTNSGGGLYLEISRSQLSFENKCEFLKCKSGNGGAMYLSINFELQSSFEINDILIQDCKALINTDYQYSQSGFGGGIFIAGTGVYDVSSKMLDFSKMKIYGNTADKAGQSLYVTMPNVIEWCRTGTSGEYVKGNYSDITSDESELEGIPVGYINFYFLTQVDIIKDQRPLEF
ncbi:MAG: hypothetical protein EZS28_014925 [Streblomastix strix]|uniref:Right handed beta helix domain-containing protein n=2 Tax=Streblomastix strix TaxID=222440 RepID=A0A5J4W3T8_9EUKA|nr:MAG: hypothetical protein EZS28_014925 [Streblomastix strix]